MNKSTKIWSSDWFVGVLYCTLFALAAFWFAKDAFYGLETSAYDQSMLWSQYKPSDRIAVIDIDDKSIEELGRWPWSRDLYNHINQQLVSGGAKVITYALLFPESQIDPGRDYLKDVQHDIDALLQDPATRNDAALSAKVNSLSAIISEGLQNLDYDNRLASSFTAAGNVIIPMILDIGTPTGLPDEPLHEDAVKQTMVSDRNAAALPAFKVSLPIAPLAHTAFRMGHLNQFPDGHDGVLRSEALAVEYYDKIFPSLALATAAASLNLQTADLVAGDKYIKIGPRTIETNEFGQFYPVFYAHNDGQQPFSVDSFTDVFSAKVPTDKYRDKIVLIGASARGVGNRFSTPVNPDMSPVLVLANTVSSLLQGDRVQRPVWAKNVELGIFALLALYIIFLLPKLGSNKALVLTSALAAGLLLGGIGNLLLSSRWLQLIAPLVFLLGGHLIMTIKRFGIVERLKVTSDEASSESNRMLGLAFQGQGQLDIAFEKFRQCPLDDAIMEPLYTLALDFERKRQFNKAGAVYGYMANHNDEYRDLQQRLERSRSLDQTTILGQGSGIGPTRLLIDEDGGMQKPMLGRYLVEKELGRGAMGTVYLGRDPKINRVVAIKTIALSEEFDQEDLETARDRFFREAETAGRLNHPDIVTVYDAGEEHDLAYIAMEYLQGQELSKYTNSADLLPVNTVIKLIARVAEALSYAHKQDVVHRDIKPANIMYHPQSDELKITDFGIARITNSSKTKTGIVLGTPSYMSPEQLAGQTVTGKSDLFSLTVTLFQLLTGQLPFRADSMATLMFKIANEKHTPLHAVRPELPGSLAKVIDTALQKDPADRYETGLELAHDLRECLQDVAA